MPSALNPRVAASITLCAAALAATAALSVRENVDRRDARRDVDTTLPAKTAVGTAPAFCKDQTWPHIDARCLKRVDTPQQDPATSPSAR